MGKILHYDGSWLYRYHVLGEEGLPDPGFPPYYDKDFNLQQKSLRLNRLRSILDPAQSAPWILLCRLYMAADICKWNSNWPFLATADVPKIDFSDPTFADIRQQPYHRELALFLKDHKPSFLALKVKSTVGIYNILLKHKTPKVKISGQRYWDKETE